MVWLQTFKVLFFPIQCRKKVAYITDMEIKVLNKAGDWQGKLLSRGKAIIIKHVLQSEILRLLVAITPLITVLIKIETCVSNFFCSMKESNIIEPMRLNVLSL